MDVRQLLYFTTIVEEGSISAAAVSAPRSWPFPGISDECFPGVSNSATAWISKEVSAIGASASSSPAEVRRARSVSANRFTVFFSVFRKKKNKRRDISAVRKAVHAPCQGIATSRPVRLSHSSCRNVKFEVRRI